MALSKLAQFFLFGLRAQVANHEATRPLSYAPFLETVNESRISYQFQRNAFKISRPNTGGEC